MRTLINRSRVLNEAITLARMKMAGVMKVPLDAVSAKWINKDGVPCPEFQVDAEIASGVSEDDLREVMKLVYTGLKDQIAIRLHGLFTRRIDYGSEEKGSNAEAQEAPSEAQAAN